MAESGGTLDTALAAARRRLREAGVQSADLDARLLAEDAFGLDHTAILTSGAAPVAAAAVERFAALIGRRAEGEPVHRILGRRAFYAHEFELSADTLEPRPDTETLVDLAARAIRTRGRVDPLFADLGTGTGAIAISLLALFPQSACIAVDIAPGALVTAERNARRAGVADRFTALHGNYLEPITRSLDMVVSNPPYIPTAVIETLAADVRLHDPMLALDGGLDGLDAYRAIATALRSGSHRSRDLVLEIGAGQKDEVEAVFAQAGYALIDSSRDLGGHIRALWFELGNC